MSAFDFVPSPRSYVGYETLNDGYDRIRIRTRVKYETVNDDDGPIDARHKATEMWRSGAMIVMELKRASVTLEWSAQRIDISS